MPSAPKRRAARASDGRLGVGANFQPSLLVRPGHQHGEFAGELRPLHLHLAGDDLAGGAVDGDAVALAEALAGDGEALVLIVDAQRAGAGDAGLAHAARHDGGVRGHAAARGENAFRPMHAGDVFGTRLDAHENDLAPVRGELRGLFRIEDDFADSRARRGGETRGENIALRRGIDRGMQQLFERLRLDARDRLILADEAFAGHVDGELERRARGAFAGARLQHP